MPKVNWGAGFELDSEALQAEAIERAGRGEGRILPGATVDRWIPFPGLSSKPTKPEKHPLSAAKDPRQTTVAGRAATEGRADPTPELIAKLKAHGPSCQIEWLLWAERLDEDQAEALRRWAALLARANLLGNGPSQMVLDRVDGSADGMEDEKRAEAFRQVKEIWRELDGEEIRHLGKVCRQERAYNLGHVRNGARTLAKILIGGEKKKLDRYARSA